MKPPWAGVFAYPGSGMRIGKGVKQEKRIGGSDLSRFWLWIHESYDSKGVT